MMRELLLPSLHAHRDFASSEDFNYVFFSIQGKHFQTFMLLEIHCGLCLL